MPRLARTKTAVRNSEHPSTTGRSRRPMARTIVFPSPGQANTYSVATAPPRSPAKSRPTTVTTGRIAFLRVWRAKTRDPGDPPHRHERQGHGRQDEMVPFRQANRGEREDHPVHAVPQDRQPPEARGEQEHQDEPEPEDRQGRAQKRQDEHEGIDQASTVKR